MKYFHFVIHTDLKFKPNQELICSDMFKYIHTCLVMEDASIFTNYVVEYLINPIQISIHTQNNINMK